MRLSEKLIELFYRSATGGKPLKWLLTPIGGLVFLGFVLFLVLLALYVDHLLSLPKFLPHVFHFILSLPLLVIGLFLMGWSLIHFFKVKGTPVPFNPPPKLVRSGPYAFVRNPMLSGVFFLLFGLGFALESLSLILVFTPLLILFNVLELKIVEEPELEKRLGEEYLEYKKETPMFFPWKRFKTRF